jgi:hypothetical protein
MLNIQEIGNINLFFLQDNEKKYIKDVLQALVITQKYIDEEYNKLWLNDTEINYDFIKILNEMNGLNVIEYFTKIHTYTSDKCLKMIYNNMEYIDEHSGYSMSWTIKNTQKILIFGVDNYLLDWVNGVNI